jgi:hypothetical protein
MKGHEDSCAPPVAVLLVLTAVFFVAFNFYLWASVVPVMPVNGVLFFCSLAALAIGYAALLAPKYVGGGKTLRNRTVVCLSLALIALGTLGVGWVAGNEQRRILWGERNYLIEVGPVLFALSMGALFAYLANLFGSLVERGELAN